MKGILEKLVNSFVKWPLPLLYGCINIQGIIENLIINLL